MRNRNERSLLSYLSISVMVIIFASVIGLAVALWIAIPGVMKGLDAKDKAERIQIELQELQDKVRQLENYSETEYQDRLEGVLYKALPTQSDLAIAIAILNELSDSVGMELVSASTGERDEKEEDLKTVDNIVKVELIGTHGELKKFVAELHTITPIMRIEEFNANYSYQENFAADTIDDQLIEAEMSIKTYVKKAEDLAVKNIASQKVPVFTAQEEELYKKLQDLRELEFDIPVQPENCERDPFRLGCL